MAILLTICNISYNLPKISCTYVLEQTYYSKFDCFLQSLKSYGSHRAKFQKREVTINKAFNEIKEAEKADVPDTDTNNAPTENVVTDEEDVSEDNKLALSQIQQRYKEYLDRFQEDIAWLISKEFLQDDEEVTGKIHSDLQNCLEKFKGIKSIIENMQVDDLDGKSIIISR